MAENTSKVCVGVAPVMNPMSPGAGSALFVINLCASIAPVQIGGKNLPGLENYRLYQVARVEDGRTRHRLRLGFFTSEAHAESILTVVRQQYPTAFTACLGDEDRRFTRGYLAGSAIEPPAPKSPPAATTRPSAPAAPKAKVATPASAKNPVVKPTAPGAIAPAARSTPAAARVEAANSLRIKALDLTFSDPPAPAAAKPRAQSDAPFHVGKGVAIGDLQISLQAEAPAKAQPPKAMPAQARATSPAAASKPVSKPILPAVKAPTLSPHAPGMGLPDLDSTQTIRALTRAELNDEVQEKWFAIQLAASEQPVNLDTMPHLDIFEAYRLYSIATAGSGKIIHSLRLGFFKEAVSAETVSGYLKTFFGSPTVLRISVAEQARFKDAPAPKKPAPVEHVRSPARVVELSHARAAIPTVTMEVPAARAAAMGSFKPTASGSFGVNLHGSHKTLTPTLKPAARSAAPATKRSEPVARRTGATGKYKVLPRKSLSEQLLDEAHDVDLSESGIRKLPKNHSLLSKLVDKLTR